MTGQGSFPLDYDATAMQAVVALCEGLARTVYIARALVENGRTVDLAGLDRGVGLLCAKALDLPPEHGRAVRLQLVALLTEVDSLTAALNAQPDAGPQSLHKADGTS